MKKNVVIFGSGNGDILSHSILLLGAFALSYSIWGGLASVAWTDVVQVIILIFGGVLMTSIALTYVTPSGDIIDGLIYVYNTVPERFSMILSKGEIMIPDKIVNGEIIYKDAWFDLPGIAVLIGGMWIANTYYWGFNQYIIQRTLAAKNIREAQKGIAFAAFLKLIIPIFVVLPGIIAYVINMDKETNSIIIENLPNGFISADGSILNDNAAPWLINNSLKV